MRYIWLRCDLETFRKRLKALEVKLTQESLILTEKQLQVLNKAEAEKESYVEIENLYPDYLGAHDTYYECQQDLPVDLHRYLYQDGPCQSL